MYKEDLKLLRGALGLTQEELAERLGYSHVYIRALERGRNAISLEVLKKLAQLVQGEILSDNLAKLENIKDELNKYLKM
jgi:transcriptional regulator with XRE-family HTH domain